ncbi:carboxymuconolactone decarboxylase family protein [Natribacillus halophilus]|uniref:Alkylhydroperoxidase AhpD family core domain-containing protein n=1 Tax=Natribacillus halophilus TaxID=549003 RepID=A0A1G8LWR9_9BACI|nr:carboxymuconolactone decarboxylase family protein [Natribacillus halophilus]SDI60105.1 alkylhydroperoxidase AhpD family core domain-containing protein [Natribacillus halophilus]
MSESLFERSYFSRLNEFSDLAPDMFREFMTFNEGVMKHGSLSLKVKELAAVAVAHVTGCPYCIELHVTNLKEAGGNKEEMSEAILIGTALKAGSAIAHGVNALNAYDGVEDETLFKRQYFDRLGEFSKLQPEMFSSFVDFDGQALRPSTMSKKEGELIAVAVAHTTGCPYCIELHTKAANKEGASKEELAEIIFVATALKAGSALAHGVNALNAYDR